jgi:hypothetical protein
MFNKTLIWLITMARRPRSGHAFELTRTFTPWHLRAMVDFILSKRDPPKSRSNHIAPGGTRVQQDSAAHVSLSSIFSFQRTDIADAVSRPLLLLASGPFECRSRGSLDFVQPGRFRSELLGRQRRTALVDEAYIVGTPSNCQQPFRTFLNFLRRIFLGPLNPLILPLRHANPADRPS